VYHAAARTGSISKRFFVAERRFDSRPAF